MTLDFGDIAAYRVSRKRAKLRENVQHHKFKMASLLDQMRKRHGWLVKAADKLRFYDHSSDPARRIKDNATDIGRELDDIKSRLDNIQRALGDPTL